MYGIIVGRLGKDAEVKTSAKGTVITTFSVAEDIGWGEEKKTHWVNCVWFGQRAAKLADYLLKGTQVVVQGDAHLDNYQDWNGNERYSTKLIVNDVKMVGSKPEASIAPTKQAKPEMSFDDDDIPF